MSERSCDVAVIGAGPGGYVAAIRAAQLGLETVVIEREHLGGICLNWGCIPTKALLRCSEINHLLHTLDDFGFAADNVRFDLSKVVQRSRKVAGRLSNGVAYLLKKNKVTVIDGAAASPVSGAVVDIGGGISMTTDGGGNYGGFLSGGTYEIVTSLFAYEPDTAQVTIPEHGSVVHEGQTRFSLHFTESPRSELGPLSPLQEEFVNGRGDAANLRGPVILLRPPGEGPEVRVVPISPPPLVERKAGAVRISLGEPYHRLIPDGTVAPGLYQRFTLPGGGGPPSSTVINVEALSVPPFPSLTERLAV